MTEVICLGGSSDDDENNVNYDKNTNNADDLNGVKSCKLKKSLVSSESRKTKKTTTKKSKVFPSSSSRKEIHEITRTKTQANITNFFKKSPQKNNGDVNSSPKPLPKGSGVGQDALKSFIYHWLTIKKSAVDDKIEEKLWKRFATCPDSYTNSEKFVSFMNVQKEQLTIGNIYVVITDIVSVLKQNEEIEKDSEPSTSTENGNDQTEELTEEEKKNKRKLKKVELKMKEISEEILRLENEEVDLDDEDNSSYLIEDRLKRQFNKLNDYYCKLANCSSLTGRPIEKKFKYTGCKYPEINKRITAWVNKNKSFPDYVDILNLVKKVTKESHLPNRSEVVRVQAQEIFREVGQLLKARRELDDLYSIYAYSSEAAEGDDPAIEDPALQCRLKENEVVAKVNFDKVLQGFVDKELEAKNPVKDDENGEEDVENEAKTSGEEKKFNCEKESSEENTESKLNDVNEEQCEEVAEKDDQMITEGKDAKTAEGKDAKTAEGKDAKTAEGKDTKDAEGKVDLFSEVVDVLSSEEEDIEEDHEDSDEELSSEVEEIDPLEFDDGDSFTSEDVPIEDSQSGENVVESKLNSTVKFDVNSDVTVESNGDSTDYFPELMKPVTIFASCQKRSLPDSLTVEDGGGGKRLCVGDGSKDADDDIILLD